MTTFVQIDYPAEHPGVARFERAIATWREIGSRAGALSFLGAALLAALLVVANEVVSTWTDGHLLAAWIVMWALIFGGLALLIAPARRRVGLAARLARWKASRRQAAEDRRMWDLALQDARVMADIQRAMVALSEMRAPRPY